MVSCGAHDVLYVGKHTHSVISLCSEVVGCLPVAGVLSSPASQTEWRMTITGSTEPYCHSPLMKDTVLAAVYTLQYTHCSIHTAVYTGDLYRGTDYIPGDTVRAPPDAG